MSTATGDKAALLARMVEALEASADKPTPVDLKLFEREALKFVRPLTDALRGGKNEKILLCLDISGSMHGRNYKLMLAVMTRIKKVLGGDTSNIVAVTFGPHSWMIGVPKTLTFEDAVEYCSNPSTYKYGTYWSPYSKDAVELNGDAALLVIITDGCLSDPAEMISSVGGSKIKKTVLIIVGTEDSAIAEPMKKTILTSSTPKSLYPVMYFTGSKMDHLDEVFRQAILGDQIPLYCGKMEMCGGLLFNPEATVSQLAEAITALLEVGRLDDTHLTATSNVLMRTLISMGSSHMQQLVSDAPWFNLLHKALLRTNKDHARAYQAVAANDPVLAAMLREEEMRKSYLKEVAACAAYQAPWKIYPTGNPSIDEVRKAVVSRDLWPLLKLLKDAQVRGAYSGESSLDAICNSLRLIFEEYEVLLAPSVAMSVAVSILNGGIKGVTIIGDEGAHKLFFADLERFVSSKALLTLEATYGGDRVDPVAFTPVSLKNAVTMFSCATRGQDAPALSERARLRRTLSERARLRSARTACYGLCSSLYAQLKGTITTVRVDGGPLTEIHLKHLALLVRMKAYEGDPFPEFPSIVLVFYMPSDGRMACVYFEQPDKECGHDVCFMSITRFLECVDEVIASMPRPHLDVKTGPAREMCSYLRASLSCNEQLFRAMEWFTATMQQVWMDAGGAPNPEALVEPWRRSNQSAPRPRTGRLEDSLKGEITAADVRGWVDSAITTLLAKPEAVALELVRGVRAFEYSREVTTAECAVAAAHPIPGQSMSVPACLLLPQNGMSSTALATDYVMMGAQAECPVTKESLPSVDQVPKELFDVCARILEGMFHADARLVVEAVPKCPICIMAISDPDKRVARCPASPAHIMCCDCDASWAAAQYDASRCPMCRTELRPLE